MPEAGELRRWYAGEYWDRYRDEQVGAARDNVHAHVLGLLASMSPTGGRLVDVGCGGGAFLRAARAAGWRASGFDPSAGAVAHARAEGLDAHELAWPPCPLGDASVEAVTFINVLDHLPDPFAALREARRVLKPGGLLYVRVPNGPFHARLMGLAARVGLRGLTVFHLYGFGRKALLHHLPLMGFERVTVQAAPPAAGDPYGGDGAWGDRVRRVLKLAASLAERSLHRLGLGRLGWGPSIEVWAVKGR
jgi:SAM-dependent methyltransferase